VHCTCPLMTQADIWSISTRPFRFEPYEVGPRIHCEVEYVVQITGLSPGACPHCGGVLEWKTSVNSLGKTSEIHFFLCSGCDHVRTLECKIIPGRN
jgi:hypothetical protein